MAETTDTIYGCRPICKPKPIYLPGTSLRAPDLKSIYMYQALHECGYQIEGMSLGIYMFEALKVMRDCFLKEGKNVIPIRNKKLQDVYASWNYADDIITGNMRTINLKKRTITLTNNHILKADG